MAARNTASLLVGLLLLFLTWGVWADVEVNMEDRVEVFRGETAFISCTFTSSDGVGGVIIQWFYISRSAEKQKIYYQDATMKVIEKGTPFTDRISVNGTGAFGQIVLTIRDVQLEDELEFICLITGLTDGTGEGRTKLKVFEKPDRPTIEAVQTGISVNEKSPSKIATCEVKNGFPKPNITWYRNNTPIHAAPNVVELVPSVTIESSKLYSVRSELSMKVMKEYQHDQFYCEVSYFVPWGTSMTESDRINIIVHYPSTAVRVWVESPKGKIKEGDSIELHCHDDGNMPSSILSISYPGGDQTLENKMMVVDDVTRLNSGLYECTYMDTDTFEEIKGNTTVSVNYLDPAVVEPKYSIEVAQGKELMATCHASSSLQTQTVWLKDGEEVSKGHSLTLKDPTFNSAGTYKCVVTVPEIEGMETSNTLIVFVTGQPEIIKPDSTDMEKSFGETVDLSCNVRGFPAPNVTWTTSDGKILETASEKRTDEGVESLVSIKVTSDITAICKASNEFGSDAVTFSITAIISTTIPATTTTTSTTTTTTTTTTPTTTPTTTTTTTPTTTTTLSDTDKATAANSSEKIKKEGSKGFIIAIIIICILLLAVLGSVLYFLYKKGKICGRSGKQDLTKEKSSKDNIVVEMKSDNTEEAVLLGVNGEKQPPSDL